MLFAAAETEHPLTIHVTKSGTAFNGGCISFTISIKDLLGFFLAGVYDWLSGCSSGCSGSDGRAGGSSGVGRRRGRKRIRVINKGLPPLSLLNHLNQAVGHKHDDDGGEREAWEGRKCNCLKLSKELNKNYIKPQNHLWEAAVWQPAWQSPNCSKPGCCTAQWSRS